MIILFMYLGVAAVVLVIALIRAKRQGTSKLRALIIALTWIGSLPFLLIKRIHDRRHPKTGL